MAVYEQKGRNGAVSWTVDLKWTDLETGKSRRIRCAAKDAKGRPARSKTAAEQHEARIRAALSAGTFKKAAAPVQTRSEDAPMLREYLEEHYLPDARVRL